MSGKKGRSGRLPKAVALARGKGKNDSLSYVRQRLPEIMRVVTDRALSGDKESAIYCIDRVLGRPRIELDSRTRGNIEISLDPARYLQALREAEVISAVYRLEEPDGQDREQPEQSS